MIGRLLRRAEFLRVAATKQKWVAPGLILQVSRPPAPLSPERERTGVRVGFTASKKVGNAVMRNRARRRLRETARAVLNAHDMAPCDLVLVARPASASREFRLLIDDLTAGLRRWKLIQDGATQ
jgi:ribonuclease P protein component